MKRIFSEIEPVPGTEFKITGEDAAHISRSLRAKRGERIVISSQGYEYVCEITGLSRDSVTLFVGEGSLNAGAGDKYHIIYGLSQGDKLESVIQKSGSASRPLFRLSRTGPSQGLPPIRRSRGGTAGRG